MLQNDKLGQIQTGRSTVDDLKRVYGSPQTVQRDPDGTQRWTYEYRETTWGCLGPMGMYLNGKFCDSSVTTFDLIFVLSADGTVVSYNKSAAYNH